MQGSVGSMRGDVDLSVLASPPMAHTFRSKESLVAISCHGIAAATPIKVRSKVLQAEKVSNTFFLPNKFILCLTKQDYCSSFSLD